MEDFKFDTEETKKDTEETKQENEIQVEKDQLDEIRTQKTSVSSSNKKGDKDPQIPKDEAPFVVLCGPPASGKSMVLKCLASYLYKSSKYSIVANTSLLPDEDYQNDCTEFNSIIGEPNTPMPNTVDYLMADIMDEQGNVKAHFLEAPGEDFFSFEHWELEPNRPFKGYLDKVTQVIEGEPRRVIFIILLDLDSAISLRNDEKKRKKYEEKMEKLYNTYVKDHPNRVILLYNKVDIHMQGRWANSQNCSNPQAVLEDAKSNYPRLFFTRKFLFWDIKNYKFLPFCTGSYRDGYTAAGPAYPKALWKEISKLW